MLYNKQIQSLPGCTFVGLFHYRCFLVFLQRVTMLTHVFLVIHYKVHIFTVKLLSRQSFLILGHAIYYSCPICVPFLLNCITFSSLFPYISGWCWILILLSLRLVVCPRVISWTDLVRIISLLPFRYLIYVDN